MGVSQGCSFLLIVGAVLVIFPHLNLGLLSDFKICGDSECESLMSRVQAIKDHHGKDCRFLSFTRGETIFVYHKLTGKREDLWAGSIDKQFGYFPKDAVQEEQVYATTEKVVETQKSDFFCLDESGYPIDSTNLDSDDDSYDDSDVKIQIQESETNQMTQSVHIIDTDGPVISADDSTGSLIKAEKAEGDENKNADDTNGPQEEAHGTPATLNEQGGSPSSSWLGSSPLGWLGLATEEQSGHLAEGEREDEKIETESETSLTSSVTGWLGFGEKGKPETGQESLETKETADSFASTMTGWLGFGSEKEINPPSNEREEGEEDEEKEPTEKFRSRRMSLDLEGSQLHEEENKEMGTLGWLGNGLSSRLGFGLTNQDPEEEPSGGEHEPEKEQLESSSWMDMGIGNILGFRGDDIKADESKEKDATLEQPAGLEDTDASRSQVPPTDEIDIKTSSELEVKEPLKDQNVPETEAVSPDSNDINDYPETGDRMESSGLGVGAELKVDHEDISDHAESEEKSQAVNRMSSMINSHFQMGDKEDENVDDEGEDHQMPNSKGEDNTREPKEKEMDTSSETQHFITQPEISLDHHHSFDESKSNFTRQSVVKDETDGRDQTSGRVDEEVVQITNEDGNLVESSDMTVKTGDDHKGEESKEETDLPPSETSKTQTEESAEESKVHGDAEETSAQSQLYLSAEESNEPIPTENGFTPPIAEPNDDNSNTPVRNDKNAETHYSELGKVVENQSMEESSQEFIQSIESLAENTSEEYSGIFSSSENTLNLSNVDASLQNQKETVKDQHEETETSGSEDLESTQTEAGEGEDLMLEDENEKVDDLKDEEKHEVVKEKVKSEEQHDEMGEMKEKEKQAEIWELKEELNVEDSKDEEIKESKGKEDEEGVVELKEEEQVNEMKEEQQQEVEELKEDENQAEEILEQEKQVRVDGSKDSEEATEIPDDSSIGSFTKSATQTESPRVEEEKEEGIKEEEVVEEEEVVDKQQMKHAEDDGLKCSNGHCSQESKDGTMMEGESGGSENGEGITWTEERKDHTDQTGERQTIKRDDNTGEQPRETEGESHSDGGELSATQVEEEKEKETKEEEVEDEKMEGEEVVDKQQMEHGEGDSIKCSNEHCGREGGGTEGDGGGTDDTANPAGGGATWTGEKSDHAEQTGERQIFNSVQTVNTNDDSEVQMRKTDGETGGSESHNDGGELSAPPYDPVLSPAVTSEQAAPHMSEDNTQSARLPGASEAEDGGAFSVFTNAFGLFSQAPATESKESTHPAQSVDTETSQPTPEQELDTTTDSHQAEEAYTASPTEQPQPHPPSVENIPHAEHTFTPAHLQINTITKQYKNLLSLTSVDETAVLLELFGRHKLQFLDYMLSGSEAVTANRDDDQSIMSDIEALLHHHRDTLMAPRMRLTDAPQKDKGMTRTLVALQKLEQLLKTVKETFYTGISDVSNHQAEPSCVGPSCLTQDKHEEDSVETKDDNIHRDEHMTGEKDQLGGTVKERNSVDEERRGEGAEEEGASVSHTQPESLQEQEGVMQQILDFIHQMAEHVTFYAHAVKGLLLWLTVQMT